MKITKIGHACFVVEDHGERILFDPGNYASGYETIKNLSAIIVTHEHQDHLSMEALQLLLKNNPSVRIITNETISRKLSKEGIVSEILGGGATTMVGSLSVKGFNAPHAPIYGPISVENIGYMVAGRLFYPGDSLYVPDEPVEILALPVAAPWLKVSESIEYALRVNPKVCFPVHDGMLISGRGETHYRFPEQALALKGVQFQRLHEGESFDR